MWSTSFRLTWPKSLLYFKNASFVEKVSPCLETASSEPAWVSMAKLKQKGFQDHPLAKEHKDEEKALTKVDQGEVEYQVMLHSGVNPAPGHLGIFANCSVLSSREVCGEHYSKRALQVWPPKHWDNWCKWANTCDYTVKGISFRAGSSSMFLCTDQTFSELSYCPEHIYVAAWSCISFLTAFSLPPIWYSQPSLSGFCCIPTARFERLPGWALWVPIAGSQLPFFLLSSHCSKRPVLVRTHWRRICLPSLRTRKHKQSLVCLQQQVFCFFT